MFKWLKNFLGGGSRPEPARDEIIFSAAPIAPPVVTSISAPKIEDQPEQVPVQAAPATKAPAKKAAAKAKAPAKKSTVKKSKS